jgi:NitT/TauT family transport system substrate-binding protein
MGLHWKRGALALAAMATLGVTNSVAAGELGKVTMSVVPSTSSAVLYVARDNGYFDKHGLEVEIVEFTSGAEAERAMVAGAVDMGGGGVGSTLIMANQGIEATNVVLFQDKPIFTLVTSSAFDVQPGDFQALKGKNIGISSPGSLTDLFLRIALRDAGLDPDTDVTIVATGGLAAHLPALQAGRVDAQMTWEPSTVTITHENAGKIFMDLRTDDVPENLQNLLGSSLQVTDDWLNASDENLAKAKAAARAIAEAGRDIKADPALMVGTLEKIFPNVTAELLTEIAEIEAAAYNPVITQEAIAHMNDVYVEAGLIAQPVAFEDLVDPRLSAEWE